MELQRYEYQKFGLCNSLKISDIIAKVLGTKDTEAH